MRAELPELIYHNESANYQLSAYKRDIEELDGETLILILDFTKFNQVGRSVSFDITHQVKSGHVHDLVMVLHHCERIRFRDFLG